MNPETGTPWSRAELTAAFEWVKPKPDWKMPIRRVVALTAEQKAQVRDAVIFFTGSVPTIEPLQAGHYLVRAAGYHEAIGM